MTLLKSRRKAPANANSLSYLQVLRRLAPFAKPYRTSVMFSLVITLVGAALTQVTPITMQYVVNQVTNLVNSGSTVASGLPTLLFAGLILLFKEVLLLGTNVGERYLGERLKVQIGADLSNSAYSHLLSLDMSYFNEQENEVGRITKRVDRGAEVLSKTVKNLFVDILPLLANAVVALIVMYSVNVWVGITSSCIVPIYFYLSLRQAQTQMGVRINIRDTQENRTSSIFNVLSAIKLIKSYTREEYETEKHKLINKELSEIEIRHHRVNIIYDSLKLFFEQIGAVLVVIVTAILILNGQMTIGAILLHLLLYNNITAPIRSLHRIYDEINEANAFSGSFFAIFDASPQMTASANGFDSHPHQLSGSVTIEKVSFSYTPGQEILHQVSLAVPPGKTVALVGLSGAGKTTIANLLGRFFDPDSGRITLDGADLRDYPLDFIRRNTGFVLQQNHIFPSSILDNIRYGKLDASEEEVIAAAKKAGLHNEIMRLERAYQSPATILSGGQMQRIAIARVFLKNPPILILDEPTASLDAIAAERIKGALDFLRTERTVLIISHNLASIIDSDTIYVLKEGSIVGVGSHDTLYKENAHYHEIIDANIETMNLEKLMSVRKSVPLD